MSVQGFPVIRRARGYRLYDTEGNRYLDMYLDDGGALLGHSPLRTIKALKNALEKSTLAAYPSVHTERLTRAAAALLPGHSEVRVYRSPERLREVLGPEAMIGEPVRILPVSGDGGDASSVPGKGPSEARVCAWRPLLADENRYPDIIVPHLPLPGEFVPRLLCGRAGALEGLPPSDVCSSVLLAALTRSIYDLRGFIEVHRDRDFSDFDIPGMIRRGCYLYPGCGEREYRTLVEGLRRGGVLLNPDYRGISIAPAEYTRGEIKVFSRIAEGKEVWT